MKPLAVNIHSVEVADQYDRDRGFEVVGRADGEDGRHPREVYAEDDDCFFRFIGKGEWIAVAARPGDVKGD